MPFSVVSLSLPRKSILNSGGGGHRSNCVPHFHFSSLFSEWCRDYSKYQRWFPTDWLWFRNSCQSSIRLSLFSLNGDESTFPTRGSNNDCPRDQKCSKQSRSVYANKVPKCVVFPSAGISVHKHHRFINLKCPNCPVLTKVKRGHKDIDFSHVKSVSVLQMEKYKQRKSNDKRLSRNGEKKQNKTGHNLLACSQWGFMFQIPLTGEQKQLEKIELFRLIPFLLSIAGLDKCALVIACIFFFLSSTDFWNKMVKVELKLSPNCMLQSMYLFGF